MSSTSNSMEESACIDSINNAVYNTIQRKLDAGFINEVDANILRNRLILFELETGVFASRYKNKNVNIYKRKCICLLNFLDKTYPEKK